MNDFPIIVTLDDRYYDKRGKLVIGKRIEEGMRKPTRPYLEGTLISDSDNTYFIPFRTNLNQKFAKSHPKAVLSLATPKSPQAGLDISKTIVVGNDMEFHVHHSGIDSAQFQILLSKGEVLTERLGKYVDEYKREVKAGEKLRSEYKYTSLQYFHKELGLEKMEQQTERELDLENLKSLQEDGKITEGVNIEHVADQLPVWRESDETSDKELLAKYGRGSDLDKLVNDDDINVVIAVANRGRDRDLDKLVGYEDEEVRAVVAEQGRDKDLDRLVDDTSTYVRERVATVGRDKDLDQLVDDPELGVRYYVAKQGRDKDLDILVNDEEEDVRAAVAEMGRDKDLGKLVNDKDPDVRKAAEDALEKNRGKSSDLEKRRRAAARRGMER
ncbi:hypothetical protein PF586_06750 [Lactobacillus delbrueckii]|uniref:HEAT repeat domain-containing protein n=1 Tax=Lactobacillus delbrueckii TaxID=1584 RepID=A0AAW5YZ03_9LACO|nr:hypothetical protein [Lactobacillus delbrueckii]MDA3768155.1 hypothetical protein [Lactobacillus delbrueckii]